MNKIDSINNEIYILGDFHINFFLNDSYISSKKSMQIEQSKLIPSNVKSYYEFCILFGMHQLIKVPTRILCNSTTIIGHILASYPERELLNRALLMQDYLIINSFFVQEKFLGLKEACTKKLNFARSSIIQLIFLKKL